MEDGYYWRGAGIGSQGWVVTHFKYNLPKTRQKQPWEVWHHRIGIYPGSAWKWVSKPVAERIKQLYMQGVTHPIEIQKYLPVPLHPRVIAGVLNNYVGIRVYKQHKKAQVRTLKLLVQALEEEGYKPREIAEKLGIAVSSVYRYLREKKTYKRHNTCQYKQQILQLYKQGYSTLAIAKKLGLPKSSVYYVVTGRMCRSRRSIWETEPVYRQPLQQTSTGEGSGAVHYI